MKENSPPTSDSRTGPLKEFVWKVHKAGYGWFRPSMHGEPPRWVISSGVDGETESRHSKSYEPLKDEPGLFRAFANVVPHREEILGFVNQHGLLGSATIECTITDPESRSISAGVESLRDWMTEILFMREMVQLWDSVQGRDEKSIRRKIRWFRRGAWFDNTRVGSIPRSWSDGIFSTELDVDHSSLRMRGWVVHTDSYEPRETTERLRSEWIETALYFLQTIVNEKLSEHAIGRPVLQSRGHGRLGWEHLPSSLLGALWLQFADAIATNRNFNQCLFCKRCFEVAPDLARRDKLYCSQTCRTRAYRTRRIEAKRLYALGSTVEELAQRFGSDPAIVRRWL